VFDPAGVEPPLTEDEILDAFRPGSVIVYRTVAEIAGLGLELVPTNGADVLPERLRAAHREIRPGPAMTRSRFKAALRELEEL
jgi:2-iminoacetate synthase ThiH